MRIEEKNRIFNEAALFYPYRQPYKDFADYKRRHWTKLVRL